jgi:chitinase
MGKGDDSMKRFTAFTAFKGITACAAMGLLLAQPASARMPVIGYFPSWGGNGANVQYEKLTHLLYSFVNTNGSGVISGVNDQKFKDLVRLGHEKGTKIGLAVGGWSAGTANFEAMASSAATRTAFVTNLSDICDKYNLDGIDMDWEYPKAVSAANFTLLMKELSDKLKPKGRFLSTAVISAGNGTGQYIHKEVFGYIDYLNIMSYDGGGQNHSSYELAVTALDYWVTQRQCPKEKAMIGVPFYGKNPATAFKTLLAQDPQAATKDNVGGIYYNGIPMLQRKTELANARGGGIMIWEISQDATGANSLLSAIHEKASAYSTATIAKAAASRMLLSVSGGQIRYQGAAKEPHVLRIYSSHGELVHETDFHPAADGTGAVSWNPSRLPAGVYALRAESAGGSVMARFVHAGET